jgi:hypothetical protein
MRLTMKKHLLLSLVALLCAAAAHAQVDFEKGYLVNNKGERIACWIKNKGWIYTPQSFDYRLEPTGPILEGLVTNVREFGIDSSARYLSRKVDIDRSSDELSSLSTSKEPIFKNEHLFLEVLAEGSVSLLHYSISGTERFFYETGDSTKQLIYKRFVPKELVLVNRGFSRQLIKDVSCGTDATSRIPKVEYTRNSLLGWFKDYYQCKGEAYRLYVKPKKKIAFHVHLRPGAEFASMTVKSSSFSQDYPVPSKVSGRAGLLLEAIFPFNKNKWALTVEPTYQYFKSSNDRTAVDYQSFEVPVGVRYYLFLPNQDRAFLHLNYVLDQPFNSSIDLTSIGVSVDTRFARNFALGAGYQHGRWSGELRLNTNRDITENVGAWYTDYRKVSLLLGYRLF